MLPQLNEDGSTLTKSEEGKATLEEVRGTVHLLGGWIGILRTSEKIRSHRREGEKEFRAQTYPSIHS